MKDIVINMFRNNKSAYAIHMETGMSFKEITHYIREDEEMNARHKRLVAERRAQEA